MDKSYKQDEVQYCLKSHAVNKEVKKEESDYSYRGRSYEGYSINNWFSDKLMNRKKSAYAIVAFEVSKVMG